MKCIRCCKRNQRPIGLDRVLSLGIGGARIKISQPICNECIEELIEWYRFPMLYREFRNSNKGE